MARKHGRNRPRPTERERATLAVKYSDWYGPKSLRTMQGRSVLQLLAASTLFGAFVIGGVFAEKAGQRQLLPILYGGAFILFPVLIFLFVNAAMGYARLIRRAQAAGFQLCQNCHFDLSDVQRDSGTCPECGKDYDMHDTRRRWRVAYCGYLHSLRNRGPG